MAKRQIMRVEVTALAKRKLQTMRYRRGMTQVAAISRLILWFSSQKEPIQAAVLGQYPKAIAADIARLILKRLDAHK